MNYSMLSSRSVLAGIGIVGGVAVTYHLSAKFFSSSSKAAISARQTRLNADSTPLPKFGFTATLKSSQEVSPDCKRLVFSLPEPTQTLKNYATSHVLVRNGWTIRPYSPISEPHRLGEMELQIKHYPGGKMSGHLCSLAPGDQITVYGPMTAYRHNADKHPNLVIMAAGTGINPVYQMLLHLLKPESKNSRITLLYANRSPSDILLRSELDTLAKTYPEQLKVHYTVTDAPASWQGFVGRIDQSMIQKTVDLHEAGVDTTRVLICGPPGFESSLAGKKRFFGSTTGILNDVGFKKEQINIL
ncbi:ferredoxin reductase-like protein [Basidiobolus meristosporus CBS 931.73]|uniref:NADH-cytochrome b5 reductase n=1 Tax=Basidiobolus meristosporus CBS 931.73 TaxID=1314790 RepID=A0A1Y1Z364_9FUNG|nr:ferredoxin reductase-like protein [Basidiobolus meristosporus CBS 931.73]|eukprot:ORY04649.1 ferredoxin reductase-like protein [Basidiobolus meristosporus CBS 931.73]